MYFYIKPPDLCEFQMKTATYVLDFSDGSSSWSTSPEEISNRVIFTDKTHFIRDKEYTVTATVMTAQGNVSSALNFSMTLHTQLTVYRAHVLSFCVLFILCLFRYNITSRGRYAMQVYLYLYCIDVMTINNVFIASPFTIQQDWMRTH